MCRIYSLNITSSLLRAASALLVCLLAECVSAPLPPRLTAVQRERLTELPLPYSVGVAPYVHPVYSEKLAAVLKASGVFSQVAPLGEFKRPPDFVATVERSVHGSAMIPALTILTAGVVPTVGEEEHGVVFSLAPSSRRTQKTMVDAAYRGTSTLGWAALGIRMLPDYTGTEPEQSERFRKMLAYRTLSALKSKSP